MIDRAALLHSPLMLAIFDDDMVALKALVASNSDENDIDARRLVPGFGVVSAFGLAVELERVAIVQFLVPMSANLNALVEEHNVFMLIDMQGCERAASRCANEAVIAALIAGGLDVNTLSNDRREDTLCHAAASNPNERVLAELLRAGAPHSRRNATGQLPAHKAASNENDAVMKLLIDAGADCASADNFGVTPCHIAAASGKEMSVAHLIDANVPCDLLEHSGYSPCRWAVQTDNVAIVRRLIAAGCDVSGRSTFDQQTFCCIAASSSDESMMALLVSAGADVNKPAADKSRTPLSVAALNSNEKVISLLLDAGAKPTISETGQTLLHNVVANTNDLVVKRVIDAGVDVNACDNSGMTACHIVAKSGSAARLRMLIAAGAALDTLDKSGKTVCHFAAMNTQADVVALLISLGVDVNARDFHGDTPCHCASLTPSVDNFVALVNAGADAKAANARGESLFHRAAGMMAPEQPLLLRLLLRRGANVRAVDRGGRSPLHAATAEAISLLFSLGANIDALDQRKHSPIDRALEDLRIQSVTMLVAAGVSVDNISLKKLSWMTGFDHLPYPHRLEVVLWICGAPGIADADEQHVVPAMQELIDFQRELVRLRAFEVCTGMQALGLPALLMCEILAKSFGVRELMVRFHFLWTIVTTVKHFREHQR